MKFLTEAATWEDGKVKRHPLGLRVRQSPFIGTIAVAPEREVETTGLGQGSWGEHGRQGHLPRYPGASSLPQLGCIAVCRRLYACQGDTEIYGTAMETRSTVTPPLSCHQTQACPIRTPGTEENASIISLACARPLEEAVGRARHPTNGNGLIADLRLARSEKPYLLPGVNSRLRRKRLSDDAHGKIAVHSQGAEILKSSLPRSATPAK